MQKSEIQELIAKYLDGNLTTPELDRLRTLLASAEEKKLVTDALEGMIERAQPAAYNPADWKMVFEGIVNIDNPGTPLVPIPKIEAPATRWVPLLQAKWIRYAAAIILVSLAILSYLFKNKGTQNTVAHTAIPAVKDIPPGGNKAILQLADGTSIVLDTAADGQLASRGNVQVIKLTNGQLQFVVNKVSDDHPDAANAFNTVSTPRGGQYELLLPDGTHIWLNAFTSLRFPTAFTGNQRLVQLTGEAYFEVQKDASKPFLVQTDHTTTEVLGTHFNVNAYTDESTVTTTLLEGKVNVITGTGNTVLLPGQQAISAGGNSKLNKNADVEEAVAWKNGRFQFSGTDIKTLMRQIGRWYDVEINYTGDVQSAHLTGEVPRTLSLLQVMKVLEESGVDVELQGKVLSVKIRE